MTLTSISSIQPIFDAEKVQKEIDAQVKITATFIQQAHQAVDAYVQAGRSVLRDKLKTAETEADKAAIQQQLDDLLLQERVMNVLIGAMTGMGGAALAKETLSAAADEMRRITLENSVLFKGITDGDTVLTNLSGDSTGVHGSGEKTGGTRADLDLLCGTDNKRCAVNADGSLAFDAEDRVRWIAEDENGQHIKLAEWLNTPDGKEMAGATGGIQGWKGTFFGIPYTTGSWVDKLVESFGGTHDFIGGQATGLYDEQGNIKRGMSGAERTAYNVVSGIAVAPSAPFAMAELLSPEVWLAISILIGAAQ